MASSQLARGCAVQPRSHPGGTAARRRKLVAVTCQAVQAAPQRSSELWRSQQSRRLLLLHAHEQRVAAKGQVTAVAPPQLAAAAQLQLDGQAVEQIGAMLARLGGDGFISNAHSASSSNGSGSSSKGSTNGRPMNGSANGKAVNGKVVTGSANGQAINGSSRNTSSGSSQAIHTGSPAAAASSDNRQAPQLPKP